MSNLDFLPWAADRAQGVGLFHVATLIKSAIAKIKSFEAGCDGCAMAPTEDEEFYGDDCVMCRRFYGDLYQTKETNHD